jgi:hypothetical protein
LALGCDERCMSQIKKIKKVKKDLKKDLRLREYMYLEYLTHVHIPHIYEVRTPYSIKVEQRFPQSH